MSRRKRYLIGKVYLINDKLVVKHYKPNRRVVVLNNDKNSIHLKRISKAANGGLNARKGIPIEKYPDIRTKTSTPKFPPISRAFHHNLGIVMD